MGKKANIAMWGKKSRQMGTYEIKVHPDQFWLLERDRDEKEEYYYIKNIHHDGYRIGKWGKGDKDVGSYGGKYYSDQLWKFVKEGDYYRIYNKKYPTAKIAKWGKGDGDWGTYAKDDYDDQLWKLTPRFTATPSTKILWHSDNRTGSKPFAVKKTVTTGIVLTRSETVSTKVGLAASLNLAATYKAVTAGLTTSVSYEITKSMTTTEEKSWSETTEIPFEAPAGKNYRVVQNTMIFTSPYPDDDMELFLSYRIDETTGDFDEELKID